MPFVSSLPTKQWWPLELVLGNLGDVWKGAKKNTPYSCNQLRCFQTAQPNSNFQPSSSHPPDNIDPDTTVLLCCALFSSPGSPTAIFICCYLCHCWQSSVPNNSLLAWGTLLPMLCSPAALKWQKLETWMNHRQRVSAVWGSQSRKYFNKTVLHLKSILNTNEFPQHNSTGSLAWVGLLCLRHISIT